MNTIVGIAPGGPGQSELWLVRTRAGLAVHLLESRQQRVLCGLRSSHTALHRLQRFALHGCRACAAHAAAAGYTHLFDLDGDRVALPSSEHSRYGQPV